MWGPELYCVFQVWTDKRFVEWQHHNSVLYLKLRAMNPSTLLAVLQLFSVCCCHLRTLVMVSLLFNYWQLLVGHGVVAINIVVSRCCSITGNSWLDMV